ncbi:flagellar basal body-associated FliL family protein [Roseovarius rhodophyticola]|uniref:Flagellar basal body-associated FliL family protein n=1 Tax=Roseovarius rhodophyticola TaxID=3080827 RepID=A0ABZ2TJ46_9RHOB|nr:flagellar basal body-associated FliL family protein [Roseovarius sp. W115]MDV2929993.1 flagellar basal body-associated FliL family protein [Roseovarius sp. W115]
MKALIVPILMGVLGFASGGGAGYFLRAPVEEPSKQTTQEMASIVEEDAKSIENTHASSEYVKLNNQFVVPIVVGDLVNALVVMSLSIEITEGETSTVYAVEPKLRDAFLQVLFDHANMGGFKGEFTEARNMDLLRTALTDTAQNLVGDVVTSVLITDIARQDM